MAKQINLHWKDIVISAIIILIFTLLAKYLFQQVNMEQRKPDSPALRMENTPGVTLFRFAPSDQPQGEVKQSANICLNIVT